LISIWLAAVNPARADDAPADPSTTTTSPTPSPAPAEEGPIDRDMPAPVPIRLEYAAHPVPPNGLFGFTVPAMQRGDLWVQDVDLAFVGVQTGLGKGVELAASMAVVPREGAASVAPSVELGYATKLGSFDARVSAGIVGLLSFPGDPTESATAKAGGIGGGFGVQKGSADRHIAVNVRGFASPAVDGGGLNATLDGVLRLGPHWAAMAGVSETAVWTPDARLNALTVGPSGRFLFGRFSADVGLQLAFAGAQGDCDPESACRDSIVLPLPMIALRYGLGRG
jgi:hypothetical protein